jgi:hypothetical protein
MFFFLQQEKLQSFNSNTIHAGTLFKNALFEFIVTMIGIRDEQWRCFLEQISTLQLATSRVTIKA